MEEKIVCSAVYYPKFDKELEHKPKNIKNWLIVYGPRHSHCFDTLAQILNLETLEHEKLVQGFVTDKQRFVDRYEAWKIAQSSNQLICKRDKTEKDWILFSEDLY